MTETDGSDNADSDIDTLTPEADLSITKTDGQTDAVPGDPISYTIVVSNAGPSDDRRCPHHRRGVGRPPRCRLDLRRNRRILLHRCRHRQYR